MDYQHTHTHIWHIVQTIRLSWAIRGLITMTLSLWFLWRLLFCCKTRAEDVLAAINAIAVAEPMLIGLTPQLCLAASRLSVCWSVGLLACLSVCSPSSQAQIAVKFTSWLALCNRAPHSSFDE